MAWGIITIYISKCAQMNPQQLPKTSKFYSRCKKCDIEKTLWWYQPPLVARRLNLDVATPSSVRTVMVEVRVGQSLLPMNNERLYGKHTHTHSNYNNIYIVTCTA